MPFDSRNRKRILIFILIPLLSVVQFFTDDIIIRAVSAALLVIYVGFIIFLRDSIRQEEPPLTDDELEDITYPDPEPFDDSYETDYGEEFKIVSANKKIEVRTDSDPPQSLGGSRSSYFKPTDLKENFDKIANEKLPEDVSHDEHFGFILEKILGVVKESYLAHSALFFWYNGRKQKLALEKYSSGSEDIILQKFELEDDILSKIVQKNEPELLTDIPEKAENDIIRYYSRVQGIKSFVGVPLYYGEQIAGVLAMDSKMNDAFGIETIYSLGRFVRVIASIISLFDEKFSDNQADQRLQSLLGILASDKKFESEEELYTAIEKSIKTLVGWDVFTLISYDSAEKKFVTSVVTNKTSLKYIGENLEVELAGTLVGECIINSTPIKIDDTSSITKSRYKTKEDVTFDGSFLAVPLTYDDQNFGVICLESLRKNVYTTSDVEFLKKAIKIFAYIIYTHSTQSVLKNLLHLDVETKLLNQKAFINELSKELTKSAELEIPGALVLIQIDEFIEEGSLFEGDPMPKVISTITELINDESKKNNIVGRIEDKLFAVFFFNTIVKDAFLWAEKLRIKVARKPISVHAKQTTFTVSVGVANASNKTDIKEILYNAELALNKAIEKGGNSVKSI
jgi:diguanylate cyclase (GGDEF)-like protein